MRKFATALGFSVLCCLTTVNVAAEEAETSPAETLTPQKADTFNAFTGRVTTNRVRMRLNPSLESEILRDFNKGDLVVVTGEDEDFFAVQPPKGTGAYVFRTFVLDGAIEGSHVNVRLQPDLSSPVIAQLNTGDRVNGTVCPTNNKWLRIDPPETVTFFVAKDYIDHAGGPEMLAKLEARKETVKCLLADALTLRDQEMAKSFEQIKIDALTDAFEYIIQEYTDFPQEVEAAQDALAQLQDKYLHQKIAYLENRAARASDSWKNMNEAMSHDLTDYESRLAELEQEIALEMGGSIAGTTVVESTEVHHRANTIHPDHVILEPEAPAHLVRWEPQEVSLFEQWQLRNEDGDMKEFYEDQMVLGTTLTGVLEPYDRPVKNRPGDYLLLDPESHRPIAYLYSTTVDLRSCTGRQVTVVASERPNHNFAFPAYFALELH